jgi:hypothetical protein
VHAGARLANDAERRVIERLRAATDGRARVYANVGFVARTRAQGPAHDGEADAVVVDPERGLLVIEIKDGTPSRDRSGQWRLGDRPLKRSPFDQAMANKHDLVGLLRGLPGWPPHLEPRAGHAVAFPKVDLASLPPGHALLGLDAPREIILDADALATPEATARALDRAYAWWVGDGSRGGPLDDRAMALIDTHLAPTVELRRLIRHDVDDARGRLAQVSRAQALVLNQARHLRRLEIVGPAGSGKSLVAVEKARRLARDGYRTLFACFNQALATAVHRDTADDPALGGRLVVSTFHRLAERLGSDARVLPPRPEPVPQAWWDETLPGALDQAIDALPDERFHALVVDEGQDFEPAWLLSLQLLLHDPDDGVLWVFHDPGQALFRDDRVAELGLEQFELFEDYRSPGPVAALAARFYRGPGEPIAMMEEGRAPRIVEAEPGRDTVEAVRRELHRLLVDEGVRPWQVVVLSGGSAEKSEVWRRRRFGNVELWNGAIDDDGRSLGLPADEVPEEPADAGVVLFETIRRFKGLEREVVVLCELPAEAPRLDALLYTALTRATAHVVVIAPAALAPRLAGTAAATPDPRAR